MDAHGMGARELETLLYMQSGLLGVSGLSSDMRTLLASDAPRARLAIELYGYRIRRELECPYTRSRRCLMTDSSNAIRTVSSASSVISCSRRLVSLASACS
jgi:hypothetical protein